VSFFKTTAALILGLLLFLPALAAMCVLIVVFLAFSLVELLLDATGHDDVGVFPKWLDRILDGID